MVIERRDASTVDRPDNCNLDGGDAGRRSFLLRTRDDAFEIAEQGSESY